MRELVCEETDEPIQTEIDRVEFQFLEFVIDLWEMVFDKRLENLTISLDSNHLGVVIYWQYMLYQHSEHPECFFFTKYLNQSSKDEVHALAIANYRVSLCVGHQNFPYGLNHSW